MPKDVLITPLSSKIEFKDNASTIDGLIQLDASDNLSITSPNGTLNLGNGGGTLFIGDGTNTTDVIFEQNGTLKAADTKTLTIGSTTSTTSVSGNLSISGNLTINGTTTTVNSTVVTIDDPILTLGGDTAPTVDDNKDRGIEFRYFDTAARLGFMGYDDSSGQFIFLTSATNAGEVFTGTKATIDANISGSNINAGTVSATYIDSAIARLNGPSFTGGVTITGSSTADATRELRVAGVSGYIDFHNALGAGSYNGIVAANDKAILFTDGTAETGALVIAPWSAGTGGLRIDGTGRVTFGNTLFTSASTTTRAGINVPHGTAPTAPTNGDIWTTTGGAFIRINSSTKEIALDILDPFLLGGM